MKEHICNETKDGCTHKGRETVIHIYGKIDDTKIDREADRQKDRQIDK